MTILTINTLKKIIENLPEDYEVHYKKEENNINPLTDVVEIDVGNQRLILK